MALVPKEIDDRITALEESNALLEERLALVEEALAPKLMEPEVHKAMMKKAVLDQNQEWVIPKEKEDGDSN